MIKRQKKITEAEPLLLSFNHIPLSLNYKSSFFCTVQVQKLYTLLRAYETNLHPILLT